MNGFRLFRQCFLAALLLAATFPAAAYAQLSARHDGASGGAVVIGQSSTTCNSAIEGALRYNSTDKFMEFCNGTSWTKAAQVQTTGGPTAPSGSGYLVLTHTTWNGNLGSISGANAKCFTELSSTYTSWRGYATALANGQITAGKIGALICNSGTCSNLMPLTTYYFAYANSGTPGGASFTTDASGFGPNNSNSWAAANHFSGTYTYWMNRDDASGDATWSSDLDEWNGSCSDYSSNDDNSGWFGRTGASGSTDNDRWSGSTVGCSSSHRLVCYVNP